MLTFILVFVTHSRDVEVRGTVWSSSRPPVSHWDNFRVTTCLENLEMSGNLKHVRQMSGMLLTVREMSGKKSCHWKVSQNCSLVD